MAVMWKLPGMARALVALDLEDESGLNRIQDVNLWYNADM
jgi:hypothetical protein